MQSDYSFEGTSRRTIWLICIGIFLLLAAIGGGLYVLIKNDQKNNNATQNTATGLHVGQYSYVYPCSVATISDYETAFNLNDGGTIGYRYESGALTGARGDLMQTATQPDPSAGYTSSCALTVPPSTTATTETSITATITQFSDTKGPNDSLDSDQLAAANASSNPNASPPTLPSFVTTSVVTVPQAPSNTLEASVAHNNVYVTLDYDLQNGDTVATATPKLDAFMKSIIANVDDKAVATTQADLTNHATFLGVPFVDVCHNFDFSKLGGIYGGMQIRPDLMTNDSQYGALTGSAAAANGVVSSCGLTFNTSADRAGYQVFNRSTSAQALPLESIYPQSLRLGVNTYATAAAAQAAWTAKKAAQNPASGVQAVAHLGDAAYSFHNQSIFQKSALNQSAGTRQVSYTLLEDDDIILSGTHVITISFQQNSESDPYATGPLAITQAEIQATYQLFQTLLTKN